MYITSHHLLVYVAFVEECSNSTNKRCVEMHNVLPLLGRSQLQALLPGHAGSQPSQDSQSSSPVESASPPERSQTIHEAREWGTLVHVYSVSVEYTY